MEPYRRPAERPPGPPDPYLLAWRSLRRRRWAFALSFLSWLPVGIAALRVLGDGAFLVLLVLMALGFATSLWFCLFPCPHCGEVFGARSVVGPWSPFIVFRRNCLHCGIGIGTPKDGYVPVV